MQKINDYVLDIGWDSRRAIEGVDRLERRIANISARANKVDNPLLGGRGRNNTAQFERKRIELLRNTNAQIRSLSNEGSKIPKGERYTAQRQAIAGALRELRAYRGEITKARLTTAAAANAMSERLVHLTHNVQRTRQESIRLRGALSFKDKVFTGLKGSLVSGTVAMIGFYAAVNLVRSTIRNAQEFQNLNIQLQAAFGNSEAAAERFEFVKESADRLGSPIMALAKGYAQLGTAARMSGLTVKEGEDIFLAAAEAAKVFGLSQEQSDGVIRAFTQMIGKQQVMAEELKLQLGDRFPPAMGLFAKSMGISVKELTKLMEMGQVTTEHLKGFAKVLRQDVRESGALDLAVRSLSSGIERLQNSIFLAGDALTGGLFETSLTGTVGILSDFFNDIAPALELLGDVMGGLLKVFNLLLKTVLVPIGKILNVIGRVYKDLKDITLTDKDEIDKLEGLAQTLRYITGLFFEIYILIRLAGKELGKWASVFDPFNAGEIKKQNPNVPLVEGMMRNMAMTLFPKMVNGSSSATTITNNVTIDKNTTPSILDEALKRMGISDAALLPAAGT